MPEHLAQWFPQSIEGQWKIGAPLRFENPGGEFPGFDGEMLAFEYLSLLEFRWGTDTLRLEIVPDGSGCVLTLIQTMHEQGKGARDGAGWHTRLDLVEHHLDGQMPPWTHMERWGQVHPGYVEKFGPQASTTLPPRAKDS